MTERKSLRELKTLYDSGAVPTLQYIRSLEAQVRQANGDAVAPAPMTDKERIAVSRDYLAAKRARDYADERLEEAASLSYPTDADEAQALSFHLADVRAAQKRMDACLESVA